MSDTAPVTLSATQRSLLFWVVLIAVAVLMWWLAAAFQPR